MKRKILIISIILLAILFVSANEDPQPEHGNDHRNRTRGIDLVIDETYEYGCYEYTPLVDKCVIYYVYGNYNMEYIIYESKDPEKFFASEDWGLRGKRPWDYPNYTIVSQKEDEIFDTWISHTGDRMYHGVWIEGKYIIDAVAYENKR